MYQRILVPIDGSLTSERGVEEAVKLALITHGQVKLIHVLDDVLMSEDFQSYAGSISVWISELRARSTVLVESTAAAVRDMGVEVTSLVVDCFGGRMHEAVLAESNSWQADLIVLGTHGRQGIKRFFMGSGAENVLRHSPIPVLLLRHPAQPDAATTSSTNKVPTLFLSQRKLRQ